MNNTAITLLLAGSVVLAPEAAMAQAAPAPQSAAAEANVLRQQLAAQQAINQQLRQRINQLELRLAAQRPDDGPLLAGLDAGAARPPPEPESDSGNTALEQALVSKGMVLLPVGTYRLTPGFTWALDGSGNNRRDGYFYGVGLEAGMPWGMAASLSVPYVHRDYPAGSNRGLGDVTVGLGRKLTNESLGLPSLVLRLDYTHNNGKDAFTAVPVGDGFRKIDLSLSAVKRIQPLAMYASLSYGHAWPTTTSYLSGGIWQSGRIEPADRYGLGLGVSLAATPDISLDAGLNVDFRGGTRIVPATEAAYRLTDTTVGYLNLGANFILHRNLSLSLSASVGVTDDADDFLFSMSLPYRF